MPGMSSFLHLLPLCHSLLSVSVILGMLITGSVFILWAWNKNINEDLHVVWLIIYL